MVLDEENRIYRRSNSKKGRYKPLSRKKIAKRTNSKYKGIIIGNYLENLIHHSIPN